MLRPRPRPAVSAFRGPPPRSGRRGLLLAAACGAIAAGPAAPAQDENMLAPVTVATTTAGAEATGSGVVYGTIFDAGSGQPLIGVVVAIEGRNDLAAVTGFDGSYRLEGVPAGTASVLLTKRGYQPLKVADVAVSATEPTAVKASLEEMAAAPAPPGETGVDDANLLVLDEFVVVAAEMLANSSESFVALRRSESVAVDTISAEDLAKFIAGDVSEAMFRLPGVSVASRGSFAVIRGLSERYNVTTLNGLALPSSDPERQSVELDQFPTRLLDGIVVYKAFSPELPGNLSGGGVEVKTIAFPAQRTANVTVGLGLHEGAIQGDPFLTYGTDGGWDLFALGTKGRVSLDTAKEVGGAFGVLGPDENVPFSTDTESVPVGPRFSLFYGDTLKVGSGGQLGFSLSALYDSSYSSEEGSVGAGPAFNGLSFDSDGNPFIDYRFTGTGALEPRPYYDYLESVQDVQIGLLGTVALRLNEENQFSVTALTSQSGVDEAQARFNIVNYSQLPYSPGAIADLGIEPGFTAERFEYHLRYRERNLTSLALSGGHALPALHDLRLDWTAALNTTYQDEADSRSLFVFRPYNEVQFELGEDQGYESPLLRTWRRVDEQQEVLRGSGHLPFDLAFIKGASVEIGGEWVGTDRTYEEVIGTWAPGDLRFLPLETPADFDRYAESSLRPPGTVGLERTIYAGYAGLLLPLREGIKLSGGVRAETTQLTSSGYGFVPGGSSVTPSVIHYLESENRRFYFDDIPWGPGTITDENLALAATDIDQTDILPTIGLAIEPLRNLTLRLSASQTIARPSLREVGNYYSLSEDDEWQHGNSFLQLSDVRNYDFRAEYFFEGSDLAALSLFYKEIDRPIEKVGGLNWPIGGGPTVETWFNNDNTAYMHGIEVELRKGLGFLGEAFAGLSVGGNATYISAEVKPLVIVGVGGVTRPIKSNALADGESRRLFDQPQWLANGDVTYDIRSWGTSMTLSVFASDRVLTTVNLDFDQYRDTFHRVDFTFSQRIGERMKFKFSAKNLTDPEQRLLRDTDQTQGVEIVDRSWHDGREFSLSLSYDL